MPRCLLAYLRIPATVTACAGGGGGGWVADTSLSAAEGSNLSTIAVNLIYPITIVKMSCPEGDGINYSFLVELSLRRSLAHRSIEWSPLYTL
jgi:hypothetical protein